MNSQQCTPYNALIKDCNSSLAYTNITRAINNNLILVKHNLNLARSLIIPKNQVYWWFIDHHGEVM
jgi:hypothetical protein